MIPPYFFTETTETEIFQINWNNWSKLIGTQPWKIPSSLEGKPNPFAFLL